jgi:molybdopterin synthase sulfur carrier subunit
VDELPGERLTVTVRLYAAARAAAGIPEETLSIPAPAAVADVLDTLVALHGDPLARVLHRCSFLLDETAVHGVQTPVLHGAHLDVLPPFAGG